MISPTARELIIGGANDRIQHLPAAAADDLELDSVPSLSSAVLLSSYTGFSDSFSATDPPIRRRTGRRRSASSWGCS